MINIFSLKGSHFVVYHYFLYNRDRRLSIRDIVEGTGYQERIVSEAVKSLSQLGMINVERPIAHQKPFIYSMKEQ